jgi:catechol 2,3-dioxygenase-like lactoylglutathione lyase family enzyme
VFDHVTIRVSDGDASKRFYELVLQTIGIELTYSEEHSYEWDDFSLSPATDGRPLTQRLHIGFAAHSRAEVDAFWQAGTEAGYRDDGAPGPRPIYREDYYGGFLLDPDGNSAEAVHHGAVRPDRGIGHLWLRVADVAASRRFYETIAPYSGFRLRSAAEERAHFGGAKSSFTVVAGLPTEHVHMAFPAADNATVENFHAAATSAGYRDNGAPGERPIYHPGYFGAYVLDPDGNNVEVVNHNRG